MVWSRRPLLIQLFLPEHCNSHKYWLSPMLRTFLFPECAKDFTIGTPPMDHRSLPTPLEIMVGPLFFTNFLKLMPLRPCTKSRTGSRCGAIITKNTIYLPILPL